MVWDWAETDKKLALEKPTGLPPMAASMAAAALAADGNLIAARRHIPRRLLPEENAI